MKFVAYENCMKDQAMTNKIGHQILKVVDMHQKKWEEMVAKV